jgi:DNA-damage-inducible protein J
MPMTNINIRTDSEVKAKAQKIFASLGLDMTSAVNAFLLQTVRQEDFPFVLTTQTVPVPPPQKKPVRPPFKFGCMKGEIHMSEDFDAPLDDFKEYM